MPDKFQNKYRIPSARLQTWNYGWNAAYFITICTQNREHFFGEIADREIKLSDIGKLVESEWLKTPLIRPDMNLELGPFIVMPNHFHAILIIRENPYNSNALPEDVIQGRNAKKGIDEMQRRDAMHRVSTPHHDQIPDEYKNSFGPQSKNLSSIIRGFKSAVSKHARKYNPDFAWQPRFHDHIIRDDKSYNRIAEYILNNPLKWAADKFYNQT
jgi:putative transposase